MEQETTTRQTLIDAAYTLFVEQGYHGTSMRHIAKRASLALGSIYNHFANKEEIFKEVVLTYHPFIVALPQFAAVQGETAPELLRNAAHTLITAVEGRPEIINLVFIEIVELQGQHLPELTAQVAPQMLTFIERLMAMNEQLRPIHPLVLLRTFIGLTFSYFITSQVLKDTPLAEESGSLDDFVDVYLHGVLKKH